MKLLFSIDHLYLHGGAEKVLTHRVNYLADKFDFDITIVTTEQNEKPLFFYKFLSDNAHNSPKVVKWV